MIVNDTYDLGKAADFQNREGVVTIQYERDAPVSLAVQTDLPCSV